MNGPGTGYRADSLTLIAVKRILTQYKPNLVLINFMEPDGFAHAGNWPNYIRGINRDDRYVMQLYQFLQKNNAYRNNTTLFITNDHGRHLDTVPPGWTEHGDGCEGCRHISLLALGPDFKIGRTVTDTCTLVDVPSTVAYMLGMPFTQGQGKLLEPCLSADNHARPGLFSRPGCLFSEMMWIPGPGCLYRPAFAPARCRVAFAPVVLVMPRAAACGQPAVAQPAGRRRSGPTPNPFFKR